jgi:hypothetical protein
MSRVVLPEMLDVLPPEDAAAQRSRRDLRRLNVWMNHRKMMATVLREYFPAEAPRRSVELGAGDGHFLWSVARRLHWSDAEAVLVDRLDALDPQMADSFRRIGWRVKLELAEAAEWLRQATPHSTGAVISNLFFHQFETAALTELLQLAARTAPVVIALEPRRGWLPKLVGPWLWAIGCGPVTRHDARISIRAGFLRQEISALWPDPENWTLIERPAGLFSHLFIARRKEECAKPSPLLAAAWRD